LVAPGLGDRVIVESAAADDVRPGMAANAVAAGARHIHVATVASAGSWRLTVDDDGVGLGEAGGYVGAAGWV
jgi:hypothetical protein